MQKSNNENAQQKKYSKRIESYFCVDFRSQVWYNGHFTEKHQKECEEEKLKHFLVVILMYI